jgi:hypothetical protein
VTTSELVHTLQARGVRLSPRTGGRLSVRPMELVHPEELEKLRVRKGEVLILLGAPPAAPRYACERCRSVEFWYDPTAAVVSIHCHRCEPTPARFQIAAGSYSGPIQTLIVETGATDPARTSQDAPGEAKPENPEVTP